MIKQILIFLKTSLHFASKKAGSWKHEAGRQNWRFFFHLLNSYFLPKKIKHHVGKFYSLRGLYTMSLILVSASLFAQVNIQGRQDMMEGNRLYSEGDFSGAEEFYRRALENNAGAQAMYNLGNTLYQQGRLEEAKEVFGQMQQYRDNPELLSRSFYNKGNIQLEEGEILESIKSYKNALRWNPRDNDARYNLAYALRMLQEQPPPPPDGEDGDDESDDQDEEQDGDGQADAGDGEDDSDGDKEEDEQEQEQDAQADKGDDEDDPQQDQQQEQPQGLDREDMERILEALNQKEQELQEKWLDEQAGPADRTIEKDW